MSEPLSEKESERFQSALNAPSSDRVKMESPLFEVTSMKREADTDETPERKRPRYTGEKLALGGGPLQDYDGQGNYDPRVHEPLPDHEVNSAHHRDNINFHGQTLTKDLLRLLDKHQSRDAEFNNYHTNLSKLRKFAKPGAIRIGLTGDTGAGKSTLMNILNSEGELSKATGATKSTTQVAIVFCNAVQGDKFQIFVKLFHNNTIRVLLTACLQDITAFVQMPMEERMTAEGKDFREDAVASLTVLRTLVPSLKKELTIKEIETYLRGNPLVGDDGDVTRLVEELLGRIAQRATENGVNWQDRCKKESVSDAGSVNAKIKLFAEQNGLAAIVNEIVIRFDSALLAQGIELVDLPGHNDRNTHMSKAVDRSLDRCHKIFVVIPIERCTSAKNVRVHLSEAIDKKTTENVILVIRGREVIDGDDPENDPDATEEESTELRILREALEKATESGDETELAELELKLRLKTLDVRDQILERFFARDFEDLTGRSSLQVVVISSIAYKQHISKSKSEQRPLLPVEATRLRKLRALMCSFPGDAEVETFQRHISLEKKIAQQLLICLDPKSLPSRHAVVAVFDGQIKLSLETDHQNLRKSLVAIRSTLAVIFATTWQTHIQEKIKSYKKLAGGTIRACINKNGLHKPKSKAIFRMNKEFTDCVPVGMSDSLRVFHMAINAASSSAIEKVAGHIADLEQRLEDSDQMGGLNLPLIFNLIETEKQQCIKIVNEHNIVYTQDSQLAIVKACADQLLNVDEGQTKFVQKTIPIYEKALAKAKTKELTVTHARLEFIQNSLLSIDGPFSDLSKDIIERLEKAQGKWSNAVEDSVNKMLNSIKNVLLNSFKGKKMSDAERSAVAPEIREAAEKLISNVDRMLASYESEAVKPKQASSGEDSLFVPQ